MQESPVRALEADGTAELDVRQGVASSEDVTMLLSLASRPEQRQPALDSLSSTALGDEGSS
eukprot:2361149-Pleurochrysis_carterae.AAC.1